MDKEILSCIVEETLAIIPARGGSKSVPRKNIRLFYGYPLIAYSIAAGKLSSNIDRVLVTTDSEEIADVAKQYGAEVPFLRPAEYSLDWSPDIDFIRHALEWLYHNEGKVPRWLVQLRPTSPIRHPSIIDKGIETIRGNCAATSLRSVHKCANPPFKYYKAGKKNGFLEPLMPDMTLEETNMPRQGYPEVYIGNNYVDVLRADVVIRSDGMYGSDLLAFVTEEIPDIDTELDARLLSCYEGMNQALALLKDYLGGC